MWCLSCEVTWKVTVSAVGKVLGIRCATIPPVFTEVLRSLVVGCSPLNKLYCRWFYINDRTFVFVREATYNMLGVVGSYLQEVAVQRKCFSIESKCCAQPNSQ